MNAELRTLRQTPLWPDLAVPDRPFTTDDWGTPPEVIECVLELWPEGIGLDPCSNVWSVLPADVQIMLPNDGLTVDWFAHDRIFVNHKYSDPAAWIRKCAERGVSGEVINLAKHDHSTEWWPPLRSATAWCLVDHRLCYTTPGDSGGAMFPSTLSYWGMRKRFKKIFSKLGHVLKP